MKHTITKAAIDDFFREKKLAFAGVSRDTKKFGHIVYNDLKEKGFEIYPVNPNMESITGKKCYKSVSELPPEIDRLLIMTPKNQTELVMQEAIKKGFKHIWIQQSSETPEAIKPALENNINLIHSKCILLFAEPVTGFHKFHKFLAKIFGMLPK